jgi:hypothetical protein
VQDHSDGTVSMSFTHTVHGEAGSALSITRLFVARYHFRFICVDLPALAFWATKHDWFEYHTLLTDPKEC